MDWAKPLPARRTSSVPRGAQCGVILYAIGNEIFETGRRRSRRLEAPSHAFQDAFDVFGHDLSSFISPLEAHGECTVVAWIRQGNAFHLATHYDGRGACNLRSSTRE